MATTTDYDDKLVTLDSFPDAVSAYIIKGVLNTNGIECVVTNERMSTILPMPGLPICEVRLLVKEKDLNEAIRIIEENNASQENETID